MNRLPSTASAQRPMVWHLRRRVDVGPLSSSPSSVVKVLAFCAIARPKRFFDDLRSNGIVLANEVAFRDHHSYTASDISYLTTKAKQANATGFVTTEKDGINLGPLAARLQPLHIAHLRLDLLDADSVLTTLLSRLHLN